MNYNIKNYIILVLTIFSLILFWNNETKENTIKNHEEKIESLNAKIIELKTSEKQLKEDKLFYKNLYTDLADDYNNRLHSLGINEFILTDTSR